MIQLTLRQRQVVEDLLNQTQLGFEASVLMGEKIGLK